MSAKTDKLLAQYRIYETLVRNAGLDPKNVEDTMDEDRGNQMRMIRQFRNFLAHNQVPGFLEPTDKMLKFLDDEILTWKMKEDVVKKHLRTPAASTASEKDTCTSGIEKLSKMKQTKLVILTKAGDYELCDIFALSMAVTASKATKISAVPKLKEKPVFVSPMTMMADIDKTQVTICTSDGTKDGKFLGVVKS